MIWQRRARIGLAVAGAIAAAVVYLLVRDRPGPPPVSLLPTDRTAISEGGATTSSRFSFSVEEVRLSADSYKVFEGGRTWYENPRMVFTTDGVTLEAAEALMSGGEADIDTPGEAELSGSVRVTTEDGLELTTEIARYDGESGVVTMPAELTIVKGRLTATGVGGAYDRPKELFRILDHAHAVLAPPDEGGAPTVVTARTMTMARLEQFIRLEKDARITRPAEVLTADTATLYFVEATEELRLVDLVGRAAVVPVAGAASPPPEMRGDAITLTLHPDGHVLQQATLTGNARLKQTEAGSARIIDAAWIDLTTGTDGRTLTGLRARQGVRVELPASADAPGRTIQSSTLVATGAEGRGLEGARFEGEVDFIERAAREAAPRTARSRALVLTLGGGFDAVEDAEFLDRVEFESSDTTAAAERAVYSADRDRLVLHTMPGRPGVPHATNERFTIDGRTITIGLTGNEVSASGNVRTQSIPEAAESGQSSAFFQPGHVMLGIANEFRYEDRDGRATYTGLEGQPARLQQDGNEVIGMTIVLRDASGDLSATGGVESVFVDESANPIGSVPGTPSDRVASPPTPYRIRAETLEYREAQRTATYLGSPVTLRSGEAETEAGRVVLTVSADTGDVERVEWHDGVYMLFEKQYEAMGDRLVYDVESGSYTLEGRPAITKLPEESGVRCVKAVGLKTTFNRRTGEAAWPARDNTRGSASSVPTPCTSSIR